jgi:hypothetical protein
MKKDQEGLFGWDVVGRRWLSPHNMPEDSLCNWITSDQSGECE